MKPNIRIPATLAVTFCAALAGAALAAEGALHVDGAWSRAMPAVSKNGAAYMVIRNEGAAPDRIVAARSGIAERVELHTHVMQSGLMKMRQVDGIDLPAGGEATLEPGGLHVMLMGLRRPLVAGESFDVTLEFERAAPMTLTVPVREAPATGGTGHGMKSHD